MVYGTLPRTHTTILLPTERYLGAYIIHTGTDEYVEVLIDLFATHINIYVCGVCMYLYVVCVT